LRILVVDDHETVRKGVCSILQTGVNVEVCGEASNGEEAVQRAIELRPDLIILDITMPVLDGFSAAEQIKSILPNVPIIMLSMHEGDGVVRQARRAGIQGFVTKSAAGQALLKAVDVVLEGQTYFPSSNP
jgi:DNA-binding NarL/FixJ family response regulator